MDIYKVRLSYGGLSAILLIVLLIQLYGMDANNFSLVTDRTFYRDVLYSFTDDVFSKGYDDYYIKRILPFGLINIFYDLFDISKNDNSFLKCLWGINWCCIVVMCWLYYLICIKLQLTLKVGIVGFFVLFIHGHILQRAAIGVVGSDIWGYMLSLFIFLMYLKKKRIILGIFSVFGAFIDPLLSIISLCLLFLPTEPITGREKKEELLWERIIKLGVSCMIVPLLLTLLYLKSHTFDITVFPSLYEGDWYHHTFLNYWVWGIAVCAFIVMIYRMLLPFNISELFVDFWTKLKKRNILYIGGILLVIKIVSVFISNGETAWNSFGLIKHSVLGATTFPFETLIVQFGYHGLIALFVIIFWGKVIPIYEKWGYGILSIICLGAIFTLYPEGRYTMDFLPFYLFPLLVILNKYTLNRTAIIAILLVQLLLSRFWLPDAWIKYVEFSGTYQSLFVYIVYLCLFLIMAFIMKIGLNFGWFVKCGN